MLDRERLILNPSRPTFLPLANAQDPLQSYRQLKKPGPVPTEHQTKSSTHLGKFLVSQPLLKAHILY